MQTVESSPPEPAPERAKEAAEEAEQSTGAPAEKKTPWLTAVIAGAGAALVAGLFAAAFLWPITTASPRHIDLAVAGPPQARQAIEQRLTGANTDLFDVITVEDRAAAVEQIEARDVQGAIVVGEQVEVLTTSAGNPQVAQLLTQLADAMKAGGAAGGQAPAVTVTDVVPAGASGAAANLTMIPALIGGLAGSVISVLLVRTASRRFASLGAIAVAGGLIGAAVLGPWFGVLHGNYWLEAAALAMGILAIGAFVTGMGTLFGKAGLGIGAVLILLIGNPWGGIFAPRDFLSGPMGTIGAYMPNGTLADLLRSISFFPDAATGSNWLVLAIWAIVGIGMLSLGVARSRRGSARPAVRRAVAAH